MRKAVVYCTATRNNKADNAVLGEGVRYCLERGYKIVDFVLETDRPLPALKRQGVQRILQLAENGRVDVVLSKDIVSYTEEVDNSVEHVLDLSEFIVSLRSKGIDLEMWNESDVPEKMKLSIPHSPLSELLRNPPQVGD